MIVDYDFLMKHRASGQGWTKAQVKAFGLNYPLYKGWMFEIVGKDWPDEVVQKFLDGKTTFTKATHQKYLKRQKKKRKL